MNEEQGHKVLGGSPLASGIIVMVKIPQGENMELLRMDTCRNALGQCMAPESDECKEKVSDLAQLLNEAIPEGHTILEVVMALDALQFKITQDILKQSIPFMGGMA